MQVFRTLCDDESKVFRQWARDNYVPLSDIDDMWHPFVQDECSKINIALLEKQMSKEDDEESHCRNKMIRFSTIGYFGVSESWRQRKEAAHDRWIVAAEQLRAIEEARK
tara:strand:+ start:3716 stop:4042 length:327 start_codon:yes stop_codon:yes gene_type:complete